MEKQRCNWCLGHELMIKYHDEEWGVPVHDDIKHFEFITLDAFQAGLSWMTIIKKRENFRVAFDNFNPEIISKYNESKFNELMENTGIVRNKLKIHATINNAQRFLEVQKEYGSFDRFIWQFTDNKIIINNFENLSQIPAKSPLSDAMSKALLKRGFKFVGSTICYAYMQAAGMVNDHLNHCYRKER